MLRYSYDVELKRAENQLLGLFLDLERVKDKDKKHIESLIKKKEKQIHWLRENLYRHPEPYIM